MAVVGVLGFDLVNRVVADICCGWCLRGTELDALEADMGLEAEPDAMPSYLQDDKEEMDLPAAPSGHAQPQVGVT